MNKVGGLEEGRVVKFIDFAFRANPTHNASLFVDISGEDKLISDNCFTEVPENSNLLLH